MKRLYLSGPLAGISYDEAVDWRKYVASKLASDIVTLSPMRGKSYLSKEKTLVNYKYENSILSNSRAITTRDRNDVMNCDMVLVNFLGAKTISIGSVIEIGWADSFRKPVVMVANRFLSDRSSIRNIHEHPIIDEIVGFRTDNLDDAINVVNCVLSDVFAKENQ